ncbi:MAG: hypothetical protein WBP26_04105 [Candidatus Saccharimonadales bacterium]
MPEHYPDGQNPAHGVLPAPADVSQAQLHAPEALLPGEPKTLDPANLEPLRQEGNAVLLATVGLGAENPINVWGNVRNDGTLNQGGVVLAREGIDIQEAVRKSREQSKKAEPYSDILPVSAKGNPVVLGRTNYRDVLYLTDGASREHVELTVGRGAASGKMTITFKDMSSTNGTFLQYQEKAHEVSAVEEATTDIPEGIGHVAVGAAGVEKADEEPTLAKPSGLLPPSENIVTPLPSIDESRTLPPPPWSVSSPDTSSVAIAERAGQESLTDPATHALGELKESWGLPEDATAEQAAAKLEETAQHIDRVLSALAHNGQLANDLGDLRDMLRETLKSGRPQFGTSFVSGIMAVIKRFEQDSVQPIAERRAVLLPNQTRYALNNAGYQITKLVGALDQLLPQQGMVDVEVAQQVYGALQQDSMTAFAQGLMRAKQTVEEKYRELVGHGIVSGQEQEAAEQFADQFIADYAAKIREGNLTQEQLDGYAISLERALDNAIENNKNNQSGLPFGQRVIDNNSKKREGGAKMGQISSSRTVTAELMVDMLRGAYDFDRGNSSPITVDAAGKIEIGQHRAAALMTLYGKRWREEATKAGHRIVDKR